MNTHNSLRHARPVPWFGLTATVLLLCSIISSTRAYGWSFGDQEKIAFIGDALVEQEQYGGWIELALTLAEPQKSLRFRNLGWSGDTPRGASRAGLSNFQAGREPLDEGWKQLVAQIELEKPTVAILGYGMAAALDNDVKPEQFKQDFQGLIAELKRVEPRCRFIFLKPILRRDQDAIRSERLAEFSKLINQLADQTQSPWISLDNLHATATNYQDAVHLSPIGYRAAASEICAALGLKAWDGEREPAETSDAIEQLRRMIVRKNQWYFHRSRPANMAYVFGFRKREQGQNAVEIPQFDALVAKDEQWIAQMRSLPSSLPKIPPAAIESKYAKFVAQPHPEFTVQEGWEVSLWAENPQLNKPIHMNFDTQGRLWVASSEAYPMIEVGQAATDKIIVLQDSTGDGRADKAQVFADDLLIPTGVLPGDGGVYVAQSTDLLFLKDTDGDGKADHKQRVLSGFGTEDTHHNLHTLKWGPDGRLYMNQSVYTRTDAETPLGVVRLRAGGGLRLDTRRMHCDIFFRGLWNSWGHQTDRWGNSFLTDGAGFDGLAYAFPGATFNPSPDARHLLGLISPGKYPKFASAEIIDSDAFPPHWQGSLVTCDFRANRVTRFSLTDEGAGFVSQQEEDLLRTPVASFRPIDVKLGPDGALYIADWSNPIINHGEVDFRDPRRDRWHGRIWRLKWMGTPAKQSPDLNQASTDELFKHLTGPDRFARQSARRVLIQRCHPPGPFYDSQTDQPTIDAIKQWSQKESNPEHLLQALWLNQALGQIDEALLDRLLAADSGDVRAAATRVLADWADPQLPGDRLDQHAATARLERLTQDPHGRVRLEAVRALARSGKADAAVVALHVLNQPMDRFIEHALQLTVAASSQSLMSELIDHGGAQKMSAEQLQFVLSAVGPNEATEFLSKYFSESPVVAEGPWIELIGQSGDSALLDKLLDFSLASQTPPSAAIRGINALVNAKRLRNAMPSGRQKLVAFLVDGSNDSNTGDAIVGAAARLAGLWQLGQAMPGLIHLARSNQRSVPSRAEAVTALALLKTAPANQQLESLATDAAMQAINETALIALCGNNFAKARPHLIKALNDSPDPQRLRSLWRAVLDKPGLGKSLAPVVAEGKLNRGASEVGALVASEGRNEPELAAAFQQIGVSASDSQSMSAEEITALASSAADGDPHRGETTYRRADLACVACHAIGGVGGLVGPDLSSLGASAPVDYIVESLFVPNAKIKEGYHAVTVITENDEIISGIEAESNDSVLVLRKANGEKVEIPQIDIVEKRKAASLMPTGVIDRLPKDEQRDLVAFLAKLGKPGEFDSSRRDVARRYQVFAGTHRFEQAGNEAVIRGQELPGWNEVIARVDGSLTKADLAQATKQPPNIGLVNVYVRTTIHVEQAAKTSAAKTSATEQTAQSPLAAFQLLGPQKADVWIDGKAIEIDADQTATIRFEARLSPGEHTVLFRLDAFDLPEKSRLISKDVGF